MAPDLFHFLSLRYQPEQPNLAYQMASTTDEVDNNESVSTSESQTGFLREEEEKFSLKAVFFPLNSDPSKFSGFVVKVSSCVIGKRCSLARYLLRGWAGYSNPLFWCSGTSRPFTHSFLYPAYLRSSRQLMLVCCKCSVAYAASLTVYEILLPVQPHFHTASIMSSSISQPANVWLLGQDLLSRLLTLTRGVSPILCVFIWTYSRVKGMRWLFNYFLHLYSFRQGKCSQHRTWLFPRDGLSGLNCSKATAYLRVVETCTAQLCVPQLLPLLT